MEAVRLKLECLGLSAMANLSTISIERPNNQMITYWKVTIAVLFRSAKMTSVFPALEELLYDKR